MAVSTAEYNLEKLNPGDCTTIKWRGKPVFIRHLTEDEITKVEGQDQGELRDPGTHAERTFKREWSIILGICTHLGCVPISKAGDWGGYFCPCHGSHYDASGRIMKGPAPENMEVPVYKFLSDTELLIG
jgi:ubiquinol-cytochrome c reductase iron-sulfur subunit